MKNMTITRLCDLYGIRQDLDRQTKLEMIDIICQNRQQALINKHLKHG